MVNKWHSRFREKGIEGLKDAPRSGKPVTISAQTTAFVMQKACEKPTEGYTNWSQARIAKEVGISQRMVNRILKDAS